MSDEKNKLYSMILHQTIITEECHLSDNLFTTAMRVPGGWIYRSFDKSHNIMGMVFVPFNNEFMDEEPIEIDSNTPDSELFKKNYDAGEIND